MNNSAGSFRLVLSLCVAVVLITATALWSQDFQEEIQEALNSGDTALAISHLERQITSDPSYHVNYYTLGLIYFNERDWDKAAEQFELALAKKKKHYESLYYLGLTQLNRGDLEAAEESMQKGLKKARDIKHWFENGTGLIQMAREEYDEAVRSFMIALVEDDQNAEYHINLGNAYHQQGVPSLAVGEYETALALDTAGKDVYFHWAEACLEMKDYTCAMNKLTEVLQKDSTYALAWQYAGEIYFKVAMSSRTRQDREARFRDVIGAYRRYIDLSGVQPDSSSVRVFYEIGLAYVNVNGFENGVEHFQQVLDIPYEPKDIYFYYGKSLARTQKYPEGVDMLNRHIEWVAEQNADYTTRVRDVELYRLLGDCYYYQKEHDFNGAIPHYKKSLEENPEQKRLVQNIAMSYYQLKSFTQAIDYYKQRFEMGIDSTNSRLYRNAAFCALNLARQVDEGADEEDDMGEFEDEEEDLPVVDPVSSQEYYTQAAGWMEDYIQYNPNDTSVVLQLATTWLYQLEDCTNGVKWFEQLAVVDPGNCDAPRAIGFAYSGFSDQLCTKNYAKSLAAFLKAYNCITQKAESCRDYLDLTMWIAKLYHSRAADRANTDKAGSSSDFKDANEWYKKVLKCEPGNSEAKTGVEQTEYEF